MGRYIHRLRYLTPLLLSAMLLGLTGCGGGTMRTTSLKPQLTEAPTDLRVVSVNLRRPVRTDGLNYWDHRKHNLAATLRHVNPDIIATQECVSEQARFLELGLPGYRRVGAGRDDGRSGGEMCAVFFDTRRFNLLNSGHFWLSEHPDRPGSSFDGAWWPRMVTWVHLSDKYAGREFFLFNTHFSVFSEAARVNSAQLIQQQIKRLAGDAPVIVTGDFNEGEGDGAYRLLTRATPLVDTYRVQHPQRTRNEGTRHGFDGDTDGDRMDWILTSSQFITKDAEIVRTSITGRPVSDHFPVTATLRWSTPSLALQPTAGVANP